MKKLRFPVIALLLAGLSAATLGACGSDSSGSSCNNNNVAEGGEVCDGPDLHGHTCAEVTMGTKTGGIPTCKDCQLDPTSCTGAGGGTGTGGSGNAGTGTGTGGA